MTFPALSSGDMITVKQGVKQSEHIGYLCHKGQFMRTTGTFDLAVAVKVVKVYPVESWSPLSGLLFLIVMRHCRACWKGTRSVEKTVFFNGCDVRKQI